MTMPHLMNCPHDDDGWCIPCVRALCDRADNLEASLDDIRNAMRGAMDETCGLNEKHCTCVPMLRARIAELEAKLPTTADGMHVGDGDIIYFVDPPYVLPWRVVGGDSSNGDYPGVIHAFPDWDGDDPTNPLHTWPDDIDGLLPSLCYIDRERAEARLRGTRKAE